MDSASSHHQQPQGEDLTTIGRELGWDVVAHYPHEDAGSNPKAAERERIRKNFIWRLKKIGLIVAQQKSVDGDVVLIKICGPTDVLAPHAAKLGMEMKSKEVDPINKRHYYREFSMETKDTFESSGSRFFSSLERCRLIYSLIEETVENGGAGLDIDKLVNEQKALRLVPLHEEKAKAELANHWLSWHKIQEPKKHFFSLVYDLLIRPQPLDYVRDYFGEKIALYFAWLDWYTICLRPLAIFGLVVFIVQMGAGFEHSHVLTIIYAIALCLWVTVFSESWKRRESALAFFWDVQDFEEEERVRPEFLGLTKPGVYTQNGAWVDLQFKLDNGASQEQVPHNKFFPKFKRLLRIIGSLQVIAVFLFVLIIGTFAILAFRVFVQSSERAGAIGGGIVAGILNAIFIMFMNVVYNNAAIRMNNWENHRTDTEHEDKLIVKQFSFKFVNTYASLAFIAFAKDDPLPGWLYDIPRDEWPSEYIGKRKVLGMDIGRCKGDSCMQELWTQLMTVQLTMIFVSNFMEVGIPYLKKKIFLSMERKNAAKATGGLQPRSRSRSRVGGMSLTQDLPPFEEQIYAPVFGGVLDEYTELMIQYGYVTLFAVAFPLSSFLALFNNIVEIRIDGFKLLFATQRPRYLGAEDIGTWQLILEFISMLSVLSNCALICFTSTAFKGYATNRNSAGYHNCIDECNMFYSDATKAMSNFTTDSWPQISNATIAINKFTDCVTDCSCSSTLGTCYQNATLVWIFLISEHLLIMIKLVMAYLIPDKPAFVEQAEARAELEKELASGKKYDTETPAFTKEQLNEWETAVDESNAWDNEGLIN